MYVIFPVEVLLDVPLQQPPTPPVTTAPSVTSEQSVQPVTSVHSVQPVTTVESVQDVTPGQSVHLQSVKPVTSVQVESSAKQASSERNQSTSR